MIAFYDVPGKIPDQNPGCMQVATRHVRPKERGSGTSSFQLNLKLQCDRRSFEPGSAVLDLWARIFSAAYFIPSPRLVVLGSIASIVLHRRVRDRAVSASSCRDGAVQRGVEDDTSTLVRVDRCRRGSRMGDSGLD